MSKGSKSNVISWVDEKPFHLQLFVTTYSTSSHRAIQNITKLLKQHYLGRYQLEIIDVKKNPVWTIQENLIGIPLLIRKSQNHQFE